MRLENHEKGAKVFNCGQDCKQIMFLISGEIELIIESNNKEFVLEVLGAGAVIGSYSIINESEY